MTDATIAQDHAAEIARLEAEINRYCITRDMRGAMRALDARRALEALAADTGAV